VVQSAASRVGRANLGFQFFRQGADLIADEFEALFGVRTEGDHISPNIKDLVPLSHEIAEGLEETRRHGELAVSARRRGDLLARGDHVGGIHLPRLADAMTVIARAEQDPIEAGDGGNRINVGEPFR